MKEYNIAVIPGDGIGNEVMEEGIKVLNKSIYLIWKESLNIIILTL